MKTVATIKRRDLEKGSLTVFQNLEFINSI